MATPLSTVRQPFGILSDSKLRSLQSTKNRQNGLFPQTPQNLKRRAPSPEVSDSENVDPRESDLGFKRKRSLFDNGEVAVKRASIPATVPRLPSQPSVICDSPARTTQSSTPRRTAAGRSPTRLSSKLDRHQSRGRFVQPSLSVQSPSVSIAAALRGTVPHKKLARSRKSTPAITEERPKSWFFDIFEESEHVQEYRMCEWSMTQSSAALDISDDESKLQAIEEPVKVDKGKENVDPNSGSDLAPPTISRSTIEISQPEINDGMNAEASRTPLGDLNAADFYGEGLTATSVALVHDEVSATESPEAAAEPMVDETAEHAAVEDALVPKEQFTFEVKQTLILEAASVPSDAVPEIPDWTKKSAPSITTPVDVSENLGDAAEIDIWESESAKDENEQLEALQQEHIVVGAGQSICLTSGGVQIA